MRVQLAGTNYLSLAEVQVFTAQGAAPPPATGSEWVVTDHLGTPRMIADKSGTLSGIGRHDYLPFGEELSAGTAGRTTAQGYVADVVRQKFTGKERDNETGLDCFINRYYSSAQGRFTSYDPLFVNAKRLIDPQRLNLYSYSRNNPLKYTDPNGVELLIGAKNEGQARHKYEVMQKGLTKEDRQHTHFVVGDGKNGFAKGTFAVTTDKGYESKSANFQTLQRIANAKDTAVLSVVDSKASITVLQAVTNQDGSMAITRVGGVNFNNDPDNPFAAYTFFPLNKAPQNLEFYSASRNTETYVGGDTTDEELCETMHHELRHVVLGDFGRNITGAHHSQPGEPRTAADTATKAAEDEARTNFSSP